MEKPFIENHHYNFIKRKAGVLQHAHETCPDPKVIEAVRFSTESQILELFPDLNDGEKQLLERISHFKKADEFKGYLEMLVPYLVAFPQITEKQLTKLFPKNKKLKLPDLSMIDYHHVTYLGWIDIATNKFFMVYNLNEELVGIEGRFTPVNKKNVCFLCNGYGEVALVSAISKYRPPNSSPDYYKAVGNYMCTNSLECNKNITDVSNLEKFIHSVLGFA